MGGRQREGAHHPRTSRQKNSQFRIRTDSSRFSRTVYKRFCPLSAIQVPWRNQGENSVWDCRSLVIIWLHVQFWSFSALGQKDKANPADNASKGRNVVPIDKSILRQIPLRPRPGARHG